jgi:HEAT repeat protein
LADHPDWQVRTQVAITLGRIGEAQDLDLLLSLLMDPLWWVRYRAAQSLASWHFLERAHLSQRIAALPDRYAQDMAQQIFTQQESHPW